MPNIYFPYLGLSFTIDKVAFSLFGINVYWYGIILTTGIFLGAAMCSHMAKVEGINPDLVIDFLVIDIIFAIIGARIYYVAFKWDYYSQHLNEIINLRQGGIAIYGAIIASVIVAIIYTKIKNINLWQFGDLSACGLLVGQAVGRYGNFVNMEAYGDYTDSLFAMCIIKDQAAHTLTPNILANIVLLDGTEYIQVHPTFFYESTWNIILLILLLIYYKYKKGHGEIFFLYILGYGIGRFWIEGLRTDQLMINGIAASQIVAVISVIIGIIGFILCYKSKSNSAPIS
ncbi:MAG: prolipoprotein diacylglyceryl transferase [Epulopiscium sp. Nele67-Bin002]|nr:MAG: prolipoprotein diacylglyceryl transferase [Epulopiscium sp. Nuni2H_MBin001]OON91498.1 MAG: prolipoprotein diacylglyceryl transferase [Epulopiscium sp. Nele67-Bin002]OON94617.1 MAG: prolipoprotein diacylglyceryl transferase [Epulopiscium sp. Nele67-Bin001]